MNIVKICTNCESLFIPLTDLVAEDMCGDCVSNALDGGVFGMAEYDADDEMLGD